MASHHFAIDGLLRLALGEAQLAPCVGAGRIFGETVEQGTKYDGGAEAVAAIFNLGDEAGAVVNQH